MRRAGTSGSRADTSQNGRRSGAERQFLARRKRVRTENELERRLADVLDFLLLKEDRQDALCQAYRDAYRAWSGLHGLRADNDRAELVLSAYYRHGRIRDSLWTMRGFAERVERVPDDETARELAYANYVRVVEEQLRDLKNALQETDGHTAEDAAPTLESLDWFLEEECERVPLLPSLPALVGRAEALLREEGASSADLEAAAADLGTAARALRDPACEQGAEIIHALDSVRDILERRTASMQGNIRAGEELRKRLERQLPDEWFRAFDPEGGAGAGTAGRADLRDLLVRRLDALRLPDLWMEAAEAGDMRDGRGGSGPESREKHEDRH